MRSHRLWCPCKDVPMSSHCMRCSVSEPLGTVMMTWGTHELPDFTPSPFTPPITQNIPHLQVYISIFILPYLTLPHPFLCVFRDTWGTYFVLSMTFSIVWVVSEGRKRQLCIPQCLEDSPLDKHQMLLFFLLPINLGWANNSVGITSEFISSRTLSFTTDIFKTVFQVRSVIKQLVLSFLCSVPLGFYF